MRKTIVHIVDDLDGTAAAETVQFAIDGDSFELDLNEANAASFRKTVAKWTAKARHAGAARHVQPTRHTTVLPAVGASRNALIRAWAAEHGRKVPARGRIPSAVIAAYKADTSARHS